MYVILKNLAPIENYFENSWKVLKILWFLDRSSLICRLSSCKSRCAIASTPSLDVLSHDWAHEGALMAPNQLSHIFIRLVSYFFGNTSIYTQIVFDNNFIWNFCINQKYGKFFIYLFLIVKLNRLSWALWNSLNILFRKLSWVFQ